MKRPLVSVIIPAYNAARFIGRALASVQEQTYRNLEILVVDDGSEDETPAIVEEAAASDERITLLRQENQGVAAARNYAIEHAQGDFIAPLDADDIWFPKKVERQVRCLTNAGPSAGLAYTWWVAIDEKDNIVGAADRWTVEGNVYEVLIYRNFIGNASVPLFRRSCLERVGGYDPTLKARGGQGCEDWDLTLRIAEHYDVRLVPAYLSGYRSVDDSMSYDTASMSRSFELIISDIEQRHPEIAPELFRWSRSNFYLYLASTCYNSGNFLEALHWIRKVVQVDPPALSSVWVLKTILKSTIRHVLQPITSRLWADRQEWIRFKRRIFPERSDHLTLTRLQQNANSVPESWAWRWWKPYDRLSISRWHQLVERSDPPASVENGRPDVARRISSSTTGSSTTG